MSVLWKLSREFHANRLEDLRTDRALFDPVARRLWIQSCCTVSKPVEICIVNSRPIQHQRILCAIHGRILQNERGFIRQVVVTVKSLCVVWQHFYPELDLAFGVRQQISREQDEADIFIFL